MADSDNVLDVLVVDDTVVYRRVLQSAVGAIPRARVVGVAANGRIALERLEQLEVDIVLLDVDMPEMDGIETLQEIHSRWPSVGVVLVSGRDRHSADLTLRALELGAIDFVPKADTGDPERNRRQLVSEFSRIFRGYEARRPHRGERNVRPDSNASIVQSTSGVTTTLLAAKPIDGGGRRLDSPIDNRGASDSQVAIAAAPQKYRESVTMRTARRISSLSPVSSPESLPEVVLIGCSTGGPQALAEIIPLLPADLGVPVLVVQHMPPVFTASLAEHLNRSSQLTVREAAEGQAVEPNLVIIAPGGRHMVVRCERNRSDRRVRLIDDPPVNSCRPSVDVLFRSAVLAYGGATLSVVLTGMGEDGLEGVRALRAAGGQTLAQSAESCVVYGMPRAIDLAGLADESVALDRMASSIVRRCRKTAATAVR